MHGLENGLRSSAERGAESRRRQRAVQGCHCVEGGGVVSLQEGT